MTSVSVLSVALLTATSVAALSVDAVLLAQMISGRAFVEVPAANTVGIQDETGRTGTDETSFRVLTIILARSRRQLAFVNI